MIFGQVCCHITLVFSTSQYAYSRTTNLHKDKAKQRYTSINQWLLYKGNNWTTNIIQDICFYGVLHTQGCGTSSAREHGWAKHAGINIYMITS